jgi:hypothetical protein
MAIISVMERIRRIEKKIDEISEAYDQYVKDTGNEAELIEATMVRLEEKITELEMKIVPTSNAPSTKARGAKIVKIKTNS